MIRRISIAGFFGAALYASLTPALAQDTPASKPTWRCGSSYSDQPCQGGKTVDVNDPRSATDRRAADAATQRTAASANAMERDRLQGERQAVAREQAQARNTARTKAEQDKAARPGTPPKPSRKHKAGHLPPDYFTAHGENAPARKPAKPGSQ